MPIRFNASYCNLIPRLSCSRLPPVRSFQSSSILLRRNCPQQRWSAHDLGTFVVMAPKQATLGYVKSSQTTLGCGDTHNHHYLVYSAMLTATLQKVLRKAERRRSQAAVETLFFHEAEDREEGSEAQGGTQVITRGCKEGTEWRDRLGCRHKGAGQRSGGR
jgi:hypothetical protein